MAESTDNLSQVSGVNGNNSNQTKATKRKRKALPSPIQTNDARNEITLKIKVSTTPESINSNGFDLYCPFLLSPDSDEIYIKVNKNAIVSLSSGNKYSSACTGYKISL